MIHPNCDHVCSGNCRRVGCNCECGEWHDEPTYETATPEEKTEMMLEIAKEANAEQKRIVDEADDRQRLHIEVIFNTKHNPGSVLHLREVLKGYLAPKGITLRDDLTIEI